MPIRGLFSKRQRPAAARKVASAASAVERLENRWLMSTASFQFTNFGTTSGLDYNSFGPLNKTSGTSMVLTDSHTNEDRSVLYDTLVPISTFTTHFQYQSTASDTSGDGFTFVLDTGAPTDVGTFGLNLGYGGGTFGRHTYALAFNFYNNENFGETFAYASAGDQPVPAVPADAIDLHSGHAFNGTIAYDGTTLSITMVDATNGDTFTNSEQINLTHTLNSTTAYVGFTGSTGDAISTQLINEWDFSGTGIGGPSITAAAHSTPATVTTTKGHLSVGAASSDSGALTYTWHTERVPSGAVTPKFTTPNAASTIVQYFKDGTYTFQVGVTDDTGQTVTSTVQVVVTQTASGLRLTPHSAKVAPHKTEQYKTVVLDQFGHAMRITPVVTYTLATHPTGSTVSSTGLFTAGTKSGKYLLDVETDGLSASLAGSVT